MYKNNIFLYMSALLISSALLAMKPAQFFIYWRLPLIPEPSFQTNVHKVPRTVPHF